MDYLGLLEHYCVCSATLVEHPQPRLQECSDCGCTLSDEMCDRLNLPHENAVCPDCHHTMVKWPNRDFAELHVEVCTDKCCHYPEWYAEGKITAQEYNDWVATLTPREKLGYYEREPKLRVTVRLNSAEMQMQQQDLAAFEALVEDKLEARLNLSLQHEHQLRYKPAEKRAEHVVAQRFRREPPFGGAAHS